jgi:TPR repeat protein
MKQCPICDTSYPDEHTTCTSDGAVLIEIREWAPGTMVRGKYRILAKIGRGGMGTVYKATHIVFEEVWALKVMAAHLAADPKFVRRFRQEAQVTRKLQHVNVVRVQDFDQAEDGSPFIVMDYIEGVSLRQLLQAVKGPLPVARALWIARAVAEGLGAAHGLGMVHRDIKPENILLARDTQDRDVPKILDFGIVAMREGSTSLSAGLLLTAAYGSPEQWRGMKAADLDGRADLYALGVSLYEMLAGRLPFHAHTDTGWMHAHLEETPPPPSQFNSELAQMPAVGELTLKLLAKDREKRPKDAQSFLDELNLLDAQLSWGQPTIVSRRKDADLVRTVQSRPIGEGDKGVTTPLEAVKVPQASERDMAVEKQQEETKTEAQAGNAQRERKASRKKTLISAGIGAGVLAVVVGTWLFIGARPNSAAFVESGLKYEKGEGVSKDFAKAVELYRRAAGKGDAAGEYHLGRMYRDGEGVQRDPTQAAQWFTKSAQQNDSDAQNELGAMFHAGFGVSEDDTQAVRWYRKSAEQGNFAGQYNLGWMYERGLGVPQDAALAASWYRKSAEQGNALAQYSLGVMYESGKGVQQDDTLAAQWFLKGAEQGHELCYDKLGQMYENGRGVAKDLVEADKWYSLFYATAVARLKAHGEISSPLLDEPIRDLERQMTPAQIAEAKKRVTVWEAQHPAPSQ